MLQEHKTNTNAGVGIGLILQLLSMLIAVNSKQFADVAMVLFIIGIVAFIAGCFSYMAGKGYPKWLGLLGLFSIFGLVIMVMFPDKHKAIQRQSEFIK